MVQVSAKGKWKWHHCCSKFKEPQVDLAPTSGLGVKPPSRFPNRAAKTAAGCFPQRQNALYHYPSLTFAVSVGESQPLLTGFWSCMCRSKHETQERVSADVAERKINPREERQKVEMWERGEEQGATAEMLECKPNPWVTDWSSREFSALIFTAFT